MNTHTTLGRRLVAALGAAAIGLVGLAGVASAADDPVGKPGPGQPGAPSTGSLIIHKLVGNESSTPGDGTVQTVEGTALKDVKFTIWQLGKTKDAGGPCTPLDLGKTADWESVPKSGTPVPNTLEGVKDAGFCLVTEAGTVDKTNGEGQLTFQDLDLGLYYVQETDAPANVVSRTAPFYVTVPLPHKDGSWLYNVNVYPKNQVLDAPKKSINADAEQAGNGLVVGSVVEWTINQTVPALNAGDDYKSASIYDELPTDGSLSYKGTSSVSLTSAGSTTTLVKDTDYTIATDGSSWTLTATGLGKIKAGDTLTVVFTTTVEKVTENGSIDNPGSDGKTPGYGSTFNGTTTPGGPIPYTYWGQLKVTKVDESSNKLAGAEFRVYAKSGGTCAATVPSDDLVATGTSGSDGVVTWNGIGTELGLFVANNSNGPLTDLTKDYCLYETKAPAGYIAADVTTVTIKPGNVLVTGVNDLTVKNVQQGHPELPLTGANGELLMTIGGLALVLLAGGGALVVRSKRHHS